MIYFVTPAWRRFDLTRVVLEQRRLAVDFLAERGIESQCVVIADDLNADIAESLGFKALRRRNYALGRKFNDGFEYAARHGAEWIVPIGSDSFLDPAYLYPLPAAQTMRSSSLYALAEPTRIGRLRVRSTHGVGPYMIHRSALPSSLRPAENWRNRGIDHSTLNGLVHRWPIERVDLHPWQYVGFRAPIRTSEHPQMNSYDKLYRRLGVGEEPDVLGQLSEYYPFHLVERAVIACAKAADQAEAA